MRQILLLLSAVLAMTITYSQPGSIDKLFGQDGYSKIDLTKIGFYTAGSASTLQMDGKIIVGGGAGVAALIRYLSNGDIDSSFGKNGIAAIETVAGSITCIAVQQNGNICVAGNKNAAPFTEHVFVARFTKAGTLDASFGVNGLTKLDFGDYAGVSALALQADGKLVMAGGATTQSGYIDFSYITVIRLLANGGLDDTFGNNGRVINKAGANSTCIALQSNGKILTGGYKNNGVNFFSDCVVSRYNPDGNLDNDFGNAGNAVTDGYRYDDRPESIFLQPDGKAVVGGYSVKGVNEDVYMTAQRYVTNGTLDNTFGAGGKVAVTFEGKNSAAYEALLQSDGKIILAGGIFKDNAFNGADYALCRINPNGSIDSSFAIDGRQVTELKATEDYAQSALLQSDGKILLIGTSQDLQTDELYNLLVRYNGDKGQQPLAVRIKRWLHKHGISWQGLDNKNISYYSIQYSKWGKGFAEKGKLSGGGSSRLQDYNVAVADAGFYRIVAVDKGGYKTFSNKVLVSESDLASTTSLYPNPVRDYVTVQGLKTSEKSNISITNGSGTVLAKGVSNGSTQYRTPTANLQPGTYYIHITTGGKTEALKFVKE